MARSSSPPEKECPLRVANRLLMVANGNVNAGSYGVACSSDCSFFLRLKKGFNKYEVGCAVVVLVKELTKKWIWE